MADKMEVRTFDVTELEVRADKVTTEEGEEVEERKITGYAAVFNKLSEPLWGFREKIDKGAFMDSVKSDDIRALWNHNPDYVLGRNKSGTLQLEEDDRGLKIEITPPETQWAKDLMTSIKRKDVNQMSFGFRTETDEWDHSDEKNVVRTLKKVRLFDVSPVTYPAYPQTKVAVRTAEEVYNEFLASEGQADEEARVQEEQRKAGQAAAERKRELQILDAEVI